MLLVNSILMVISTFSIQAVIATLAKDSRRGRMIPEGSMELSQPVSFSQAGQSVVACGGIALMADCRVFVYDTAIKKCAFYTSANLHSGKTLIRKVNGSTQLWTLHDYDRKDDQCLNNPCQNGGVCVDEIDSYFCICVKEFKGKICEEVNECASNPCQNGGSCSDFVGRYSCSCVQGYSGYSCEINIDECVSNPCLNGGGCNDLVNAYSCSCASGYSGSRCQTDINECVSNPCLNGGVCTDLVNAYSCSCASGYSGTRCQTNIDECASSPCQNGGVCTDLVNAYSCSCLSGYSGTRCQTDVDECASNPCLNGGVCSDLVNAFSCSCPTSYTGKRCQTQTEIYLKCSADFDNGFGDGYIKLKTRSVQPNILVRDGYECGMNLQNQYMDLTETLDISTDLKTLILSVKNSPSASGYGYFNPHRITLSNFPATITGFTKQSDNYDFRSGGDKLTKSFTSSSISIHVPRNQDLYGGDTYRATFKITIQ